MSVVLSFAGSLIAENGVSGPFHVVDAFVTRGTVVEFSEANIFKTQAYAVGSFQPPDPDGDEVSTTPN